MTMYATDVGINGKCPVEHCYSGWVGIEMSFWGKLEEAPEFFFYRLFMLCRQDTLEDVKLL